MRRADRLFQLVQLLRKRRSATSAEIAEALEISVRTVYRDIRDLELSGVPIRGEAGVGYRLERGFELPPLTFRADEIEALVLGARVVASWGDAELADAARSAMARIAAAAPASLHPVLASAGMYAPATGRAERASARLGPLRKAIRDRHKLAITYVDERGEASQRVIWPLGLYFWGPSWSLAAYCELRQDFRSFRPDRMAGVEVLDATLPDDAPDLRAFVQAMAARDGTTPGEVEGTGWRDDSWLAMLPRRGVGEGPN